MQKTKKICGNSISLHPLNKANREDDVPSIDIAISPEHRSSGFGYDTAKTLCEYLLSKTGIDSVYWYAMPNIKASIRIAENLVEYRQTAETYWRKRCRMHLEKV